LDFLRRQAVGARKRAGFTNYCRFHSNILPMGRILHSGRSAGTITLNAAGIGAALFVTVGAPAGTRPVAVFAAPWSADAAQIVAQAGGQLVAAGRSPRIVTAVSTDEGFVGRLYLAGAILVTDSNYAIGCHVEPVQRENE
jgi:hypothetical protein